jgi:hypothetical protein
VSRFSKVERRMWGDAKFRALSKPAPNARDLWVYLITGPHNTSVPGLFMLGEAAMAEAMEWPLPATRKAFAEIVDAGMAKFDPTTRLVWLPNALRHNPPENFNVVVGWRAHWAVLPECALLNEATVALEAGLAAVHASYVQAFAVARGKAPPRPSPNPSGKAKADPSAKGQANPSPNPLVDPPPNPGPKGQPNPEPEPEPEPEPTENTPLPPRAEGEGRASKAKAPTDRDRVFAEWCRVMDSPRSKMDRKRAARIDWALATYGLEVCTQAIAGCRADPFSMGQNDRGRKFNDPTLIFRDAEHVEKFAALAPKPAPPPTAPAKPVDPDLLAQNEQLRQRLAEIAAQKQRERDQKFALVHPEAANA